MPVRTYAAVFSSMRERPFWKLLAANTSFCILAVLRHRLFDRDDAIAASAFYAQIEEDLDLLNSSGHSLAQTAKEYVRQWLDDGFIIRRLPADAKEEEFELSADAAAAIRFVMSQDEKRSGISESRLSTVLQELERLVEDTDTTPESRRCRLLNDQKKIADELARLDRGEFDTISAETAEERIHNVLSLTVSLPDDFIGIRNEFEQLHRSLRDKIVKETGVSGEILDTVFEGVEDIDASEAGRSFHAFWRMLTNPEKRNAIDAAIAILEDREALAGATPETWYFLRRLTSTLLERAGRVHTVVMQLSQSLKQFVQSREYREQSALRRLIADARQEALNLVDIVSPQTPLGISLWLTTSSLSSLGRWSLYDPEESSMNTVIIESEPITLSNDEINDWIAQSDIDWVGLEDDINYVLVEREHATIGDVLTSRPARQGLGSVVGLVMLACDRGAIAGPEGQTEKVEWGTEDGEIRRASVPVFFFAREESE